MQKSDNSQTLTLLI